MAIVLTYEQQNAEIKRLLQVIGEKCENFAKQAESPYYGDLNHVIEDLAEINLFLNEKYLNQKEKENGPEKIN